MMCIRVDLPEPDGPMNATKSPSLTRKLTPRSAWTARSPGWYVFQTFWMSMIGRRSWENAGSATTGVGIVGSASMTATGAVGPAGSPATEAAPSQAASAEPPTTSETSAPGKPPPQPATKAAAEPAQARGRRSGCGQRGSEIRQHDLVARRETRRDLGEGRPDGADLHRVL